ncbi:MAG TPA: MFS transporter [Spirochaetota bacterium]|nr:MFS transporter [Spirochaetota bacterium]
MEVPRTGRPVLTMLAVMGGVFLTAFLGSSLNIAIPDIENEFSVPASLIGWVATAYILTNAAFLLIAGWFGDRYGRILIYLVGLGITTGTTALAILSKDVTTLIIIRAVQGVGSALVFANSVAIVSDAFPPERRGRALGLTIAATYLGLSLGPVIGGALIHESGWRSVFLPPLLIGLLSLFASWRILSAQPAHIPHRTSRVDCAGSLLSILAPVLFVSGISILGRNPTGGILAILAGILTLFIFILVERARPGWRLMDISLFSESRLFSFSCLAALLNYSATFGGGFLLSVWLQYTRGLAPHEAGLILVIQPAIQALLSPLFGHISDRVDKRLLASAGMALTALAIFWFAITTLDDGLTGIMAGLSLSGTGFALFSSPNSNAIMSAVSPPQYGAASSILALARTAGQLFSMGLVTAGLTLGFGSVKLGDLHPTELSASISLLFTIMGALTVPGILFSLLRNKGKVQSSPRGNV